MSWIARTFLFPISVAFYLCLALVLAVLIELVIVNSSLVPQGIQNSEDRIDTEREQFTRLFSTSYLVFDPKAHAISIQRNIQDYLFEVRNASLSDAIVPISIKTFMQRHAQSLTLVIEIFVLRSMSVVSIVPVLLLICIVFCADGFVRRWVRKASAGLESARLYHFAKRSIRPVFLWACLLFLTLPTTLDVRWLHLLLIGLLPILSGMAVSRFKKYV